MKPITGPWSDRAGRKKLILFPILGYCFMEILFLVNSIFFEELVVEYLMLEIFQVPIDRFYIS